MDTSRDSVQSEVPLCLLLFFSCSGGHEAALVPLTQSVQEVDPGQDVSDAQDAAPAEVLLGQPFDEVQHQFCNVQAWVSFEQRENHQRNTTPENIHW